MRQGRQKQEPFFVKRIRLRKSVIKTSQILENISIVGQETTKYSTLSDNFRRKQIDMMSKGKKITLDQTCMSNFETFSNHYQLSNMKNILKIYKNTKEKQTEIDMRQIGLEVRRIIGDPSHKKSYQFSCDISDKARTKRQVSTVQRFNLTSSNNLTIDSSENQIIDYPHTFCETRAIESQKTDRNVMQSINIGSPTRKNKVYLYQKLAQSQKVISGQQNQIYEKRIQSYTDFLWKMMLAHNIYINIDLGLSHTMIKKKKCYIGFGNNCNMIRGLIKRRFWWTISEEITQDCLFVWTQIKVNKIFEKQQKSHALGAKYLDSGVLQPNLSQMRITQSTSLKKRSGSTSNIMKRLNDEKFTQLYLPHRKLWNEADFCILEKYCKKSKIIATERDHRLKKTKKTYNQLTYQIRKKYKQISVIEEIQSKQEQSLRIQQNSYYKVPPIVHNHLQNNFFLGNKKALFYNLRQYYTKKHMDPFEFIPLTFHIKKGFKDPQYNRFIKYYGTRAKQIKQQTQQGEKSKVRNIWIVKPGQNSNQGRGITVIDQIYELNQIIKDSITPINKSNRQKLQKQQPQRTFIVQMYIDRPFLYNSRKFDIRHYMLITNLYGITRAYWYEEGYVRTSSYLFNINNFQPEIHLTNDAIQKQYPQYGRYQNANKVSYSQFQNYLNTYSQKKYNFRDEILPKMKEMAVDAAKSVYNKISPSNLMHNFQIFGLDFMIDRDFKPWLIEINTNPCLDCVCPLLQRIIPYMVEQSLKLSLDIIYPPPCHYPNTSKHYAPMVSLANFKYELIFDSSTEGKQIKNLYSKRQSNLLKQIGEMDDDQQFKDNGKQAKLQDFT